MRKRIWNNTLSTNLANNVHDAKKYTKYLKTNLCRENDTIYEIFFPETSSL